MIAWGVCEWENMLEQRRDTVSVGGLACVRRAETRLDDDGISIVNEAPGPDWSRPACHSVLTPHRALVGIIKGSFFSGTWAA